MTTNVENLKVGAKIGKFEVTGIKMIVNHGEYYPNTNVVCEVFVKGLRGATYQGWVKKNGSVELITQFGTQKPLFEGLIHYDGTKGCIVGVPEHKCKYCGCMTIQPDNECYARPK